MKKCPKCNKVYDDTWGICIQCNTKLIVSEEAGAAAAEAKPSMLKLDDKAKEKLLSARKYLKRDVYIDLFSFVGIFAFMGLATILEAIGILAVVCVFVWFIWRIVVVFRIRYVFEPIGKSRGEITLYQLIAFAVPFGEIIFGFEALRESGEVIK